MNEQRLNTIINNNFKSIGFSHKIADPAQGVGSQRPFDGFSVFNQKNFYWETKLLKGYQAFSFGKIEEHQLLNLLLIKQKNQLAISLIILGVFIPYKFFDLFFFDINFIHKHILKGKKSFLKKELLFFKERNLFLSIKKEIFDIAIIMEKIIR